LQGKCRDRGAILGIPQEISNRKKDSNLLANLKGQVNLDLMINLQRKLPKTHTALSMRGMPSQIKIEGLRAGLAIHWLAITPMSFSERHLRVSFTLTRCRIVVIPIQIKYYKMKSIQLFKLNLETEN
jgi:hypothetical protein